jgi:hypothetical protein
MSEMGQTRKFGLATGKSALPSRTDIVSVACQVRKVPIGEVTTQLSLSSCSLALLRSGVLNPSVNH